MKIRKFPIYRIPGYCHCGAPCGKRVLRCRKCQARFRWYRRKAWRTNLGRRSMPRTKEKG
jgi:hypothetical protein